MTEGHGGWRYCDEQMRPIWITSHPTTRDAALRYGKFIIESFPGVQLAYIEHRAPGEGTYKLLPYKWVDGKFIDIAEALG